MTSNQVTAVPRLRDPPWMLCAVASKRLLPLDHRKIGSRHRDRRCCDAPQTINQTHLVDSWKVTGPIGALGRYAATRVEEHRLKSIRLRTSDMAKCETASHHDIRRGRRDLKWRVIEPQFPTDNRTAASAVYIHYLQTPEVINDRVVQRYDIGM